ncbi:MAG TPA: single-stranded DNA-binding protein [Candidatus Dojkabacteria bacterium]|nr:single-stranded DNA-binding protein [Candidatus Dojkabacteria bacterium]
MASRSLNKVLLIGNLTRDPEMRYTNSGTPVVTFGLATNKSWKDADGETKELAEFHNLVAWNKMAEICQQLLAKGMKVYIEGSLNTRSWEAEDGSTKYKTEIRVEDMILLDSKGKQGVGSDGENNSSSKKKEEKEEEPAGEEVPEEAPSEDQDPLEEDLPF